MKLQKILVTILLFLAFLTKTALAIEAFPAASIPFYSNENGSLICALVDGRILVAGGDYKDEEFGWLKVRSSYLYDIATNTWTPTGDLVHGNAFFNGILLDDGRVLAGPGYSAPGSTPEVYDPTTGVWASISGPPNGFCGETLTKLQDGRVLAAGLVDNSAWIFDPQHDTWTPTGSLSQNVRSNAMATMSDGRVLSAGGEYTGSTKRVEIFDPTVGVGTWTLAPNMGNFRYAAASIALPNGKILVSHGYSVYTEVNSYEIYDPMVNSWSTRTEPVPCKRPSWDIGACGKAPMLIQLTCGKILGNNGLYDPVTDQCTLLNPTLTSGTYPFRIGQDKVLWIADNGACTLWSLKPTVSNQSLSAHRNTVVPVNGTADVVGTISSWSVISGPSHGTLTGTSPAWNYTPQADYVGDDTFTYTVTDATYGTSSPGIVTIHLTNSGPMTADLGASFNQDTIYSGTFTGIDADGDALTWNVVTLPAHGVVTMINPTSGAFQYSHDPGVFTDAVIGFSVSDGLATASGVLTLHINRVNHAPSFIQGADFTVTESPIPFTATSWVSQFDSGSPDEVGQQVAGYSVTTNHPEVFHSQPAISNAGTLTFIPAGNIDVVTTVIMSITVRDDGGTDFGGTDVSTPVTATITMTPNSASPQSSSGGRKCGSGSGLAALALAVLMLGLVRHNRA